MDPGRPAGRAVARGVASGLLLAAGVIAGLLGWIAVGLLDSTGRSLIGLWTGPGALAGILLGWFAEGETAAPA